MTSAAALRAALGDPSGIPPDQVTAYFEAIAAGAESAGPPPAGAVDLTRRALGPIRPAATQNGAAA